MRCLPKLIAYTVVALVPSATVLAQQYSRPQSDIGRGSWTGTTSSVVLYQDVDETSPSDVDYMYNLGTSSSTANIQLSPVDDPGTDDNHTVRFRHQKSGGAAVTITVTLYDGTTTIASWEVSPSSSWITSSNSLTTGEAATIGDYSNLRVEVLRSISSLNVETRVSWIEFEVPNATRRILISQGQLPTKECISEIKLDVQKHQSLTE